MGLEFRRPAVRPTDHWTLPAPRLVEFRCPAGGHLLAVIYDTHAGPLCVSTARVVDPEIRRNVVRRKSEGRRVPWGGKLPGDPSPRLPLVDEPFSDDPVPLNCRCGSWAPLTRAALRDALDGLGQLRVITVSERCQPV